MVGLSKTDQISQQLVSSPGADATALMSWVEYCTQRDAMLHRTTNCALASWLLVFSAATLSTLMAWHFQNSTLEVLEVFHDGNPPDGSFSGYLIPILLLNCVLCGLLPFAWRKNLVPLFRKLRNDIDWTTIGNAMGQLTPLGIPYPAAFRLTAGSLRCESHRKWLEGAARNVEAGKPVIPENLSNGPNTAVLHAVLSNPDSMVNDWKAVAQHYDSCSKQTLSMLLAAIPIAATLVAGLILWFSITSTFGDFYRMLGSSIEQLGY
ncbi:MAG: hypothetical protein ACR2OA_15800 [Rubripirellula sp.]